MGHPAKRNATYEDVLAAPEHLVAEIIDGDLELSPRPGKPHAIAAGSLYVELEPPFRRGRGGPGGWIFVFEPELHLGPNVLVPDIAAWRRERMPVLVDDEPYFTLPADWICEVLSPSTAKLDRARKLPLYARAGVQHAWLIDPRERLLEVLRRVEDKWLTVTTLSDDAPVRAEPFDAIEFPLTSLWADVVLSPERK